MDEELKNFIKVWVSVIISASYCYYVPTRIKSGIFRFLSVRPVCALFLVLPLFFSSVHFSGSTAFFLSWLANVKLILFCFDKGPLFPLPSNLPRFICFACFPIKLQQNPKHRTFLFRWENPIEVLFSNQFVTKVVILGVVLHLYNLIQHLYPVVLLFLYPLHLYLVLEILLKLVNAFFSVALDCELEPQLNEPYLSCSLRDFWGHLWTLMLPTILRPVVYARLQRTTQGKMNPDQSLYLGVIVAFLISGVLHELLFFYITREPPTGKVTLFFVLHGVCIVAYDARLKKKIIRWTGFEFGPCLMLQVVVMGFVVVTAGWLFFPPLVRTGETQRFANEALFFIGFVKRKFFTFGSIMNHSCNIMSKGFMYLCSSIIKS
ncbi:PREDICTED: probable long-chain-alcohol O-fatty-acyltransferase 11 [Camelina sativa]|uniref:long-chain-alcohol O-fatty-acyltransferase n=1 Tax=Camelina sativa TaxID=90675 RepID=A0ABM1QLI1_CAMSA|nr:PREDICTED: probable long-chain-alcohol O-fatty-acyltransferase 11 [Camelina sativa]